MKEVKITPFGETAEGKVMLAGDKNLAEERKLEAANQEQEQNDKKVKIGDLTYNIEEKYNENYGRSEVVAKSKDGNITVNAFSYRDGTHQSIYTEKSENEEIIVEEMTGTTGILTKRTRVFIYGEINGRREKVGEFDELKKFIDGQLISNSTETQMKIGDAQYYTSDSSGMREFIVKYKKNGKEINERYFSDGSKYRINYEYVTCSDFNKLKDDAIEKAFGGKAFIESQGNLSNIGWEASQRGRSIKSYCENLAETNELNALIKEKE